MPTRFARPPRMPMWIGGIAVVLLTASGMVAIARSIPASFANIPDGGASSRRGAAPSGSDDAQAKLATAEATINRRNQASCPECGVIESMRQIERSADVSGKRPVDAKGARRPSGGASGSTIAANARAGNAYEITVRLRDGSTTVFNEATPRSWQTGSRVIVIGGPNESRN